VVGTKKKIMDAALALFAERGYANVYVAQIADAVGIKAPSLYKHYKSKQEIFGAILTELKTGYHRQAAALQMNGNDAMADARMFSAASEEELVKIGMGLFAFFLHDDYAKKCRRMMTVEQFRDPELAQLLSQQYADDPLAYQSAMFAYLGGIGVLRQYDPGVMALQFYAPIHMLLSLCDRHPEREGELTALLEKHIRQFSSIYAREEAK
jgi:AcrR family transcriptional regulator